MNCSEDRGDTCAKTIGKISNRPSFDSWLVATSNPVSLRFCKNACVVRMTARRSPRTTGAVLHVLFLITWVKVLRVDAPAVITAVIELCAFWNWAYELLVHSVRSALLHAVNDDVSVAF